ncbi:MAG: nucleoid-associated protein R00231 [Alphaproteobacteria bacterium]|nr:MAG: nucleoid-associated protein R00231 [Alphaproteobacteria bacterium]
MKDLMGLMKQAREMQSKWEDMQTALASLAATGTAGGGLVSVTLSGKGELKGVTIDASLLSDGEAEILEDLLVAAHANARQQVEALVAEKTRELTAGLPLPPGLKLPF